MSIITSSFFDDNPPTNFKFLPLEEEHLEILSALATISDMAQCLDTITNIKIEGIFALYNNFLVYHENDQPHSIIDLLYSRISRILTDQTQQIIGFELTKNGTSFQFYFPEQSTIKFWISALKNICIMTNFHDEYQGVTVLGKGNFARVYLVESKTTKTRFAVKSFNKDALTNSSKPKPKASILNEIEVLRSLNHPHIAQLYEVQETENSIYLVTEYFASKTLQEILKTPNYTKFYSDLQVMSLMHSIMDALVYLSSRGIMHRDLKPSNIIVDKKGNLKIIDFGLADSIHFPKNIYRKCGTSGYTAPEILKLSPGNMEITYGLNCDMFSIGCIFFYMFFGYPFFGIGSAAEVYKLNREVNEEMVLFTLTKELKCPTRPITREVLNLIVRLLDSNPETRINAEEAFSHPYFRPLMSEMVEFPDGPDTIFDNRKLQDDKAYEDCSLIFEEADKEENWFQVKNPFNNQRKQNNSNNNPKDIGSCDLDYESIVEENTETRVGNIPQCTHNLLQSIISNHSRKKDDENNEKSSVEILNLRENSTAGELEECEEHIEETPNDVSKLVERRLKKNHSKMFTESQGILSHLSSLKF